MCFVYMRIHNWLWLLVEGSGYWSEGSGYWSEGSGYWSEGE